MMSAHAADPPNRASVRLVVTDHRPSKLSEPPVTSAQPLWRLVRDGHTAEAKVRPIENVGVELRYEWNGEQRVSQMFKAWEALEAAATEKRQELEVRGLAVRTLMGRVQAVGQPLMAEQKP